MKKTIYGLALAGLLAVGCSSKKEDSADIILPNKTQSNGYDYDACRSFYHASLRLAEEYDDEKLEEAIKNKTWCLVNYDKDTKELLDLEHNYSMDYCSSWLEKAKSAAETEGDPAGKLFFHLLTYRPEWSKTFRAIPCEGKYNASLLYNEGAAYKEYIKDLKKLKK